MRPQSQGSAIRWLEVYNAGNEDIPPCAVCRVTGVDSDTGIITVDKPNGDSLREIIIAGPQFIRAGEYGQGHRADPCPAVLYETADGTPAAGEDWGTKADSWKIHKGRTGFRALGKSADNVCEATYLGSSGDGGQTGYGVIARITGNDGGTPKKYSWEQVDIDSAGTITTRDPAVTGTENAVELNSLTVATGEIVALFRTGDDSFYWFASNMTGADPGTLTVEEVDGSPSLTEIGTLQFDQADGFIVSQPASNKAKVKIAPATITQIGVVSTDTQHFYGNKDFQLGINAASGLHAGMILGTNVFPTWALNWPLSLGEYTNGGTSVGPIVGLSYEFFSVDHYTMASWQLLDNTSTVIAKVRLQEGGTLEVFGTDPKIKVGGSTGQTATEAGLSFVGGVYVGGTFSGGSNYTDEQAQDAVGTILTDSANIDFTYDDAANTITADLTDTGITAGIYAQIQVDAKGRATSGQANLDATNLGALNTLTSATPDGWDVIAFYDVSASANRQCTLNALLALAMPTGAILPFGGSTIPTGFLECDGSAVSRYTYATLFAAIGTTWGAGDGSTTFNLPDLRGRSPLGAGTGSGLTARTLGGTGGAETVALATSELPSHNHQIKGADGSTIYKYTTGGANPRVAGVADSTSSTVYTTENNGSGSAHANMHPYAVVKFMIKT